MPDDFNSQNTSQDPRPQPNPYVWPYAWKKGENESSGDIRVGKKPLVLADIHVLPYPAGTRPHFWYWLLNWVTFGAGLIALGVSASASMRVNPPKPVIISCDPGMEAELKRAGEQLEGIALKTMPQKK